MKKKTMQTIFVVLFILGVIIGYLLPGDIRALTKKPLQPNIFDVPKKLGQLDLETDYFKYTVLASTETGSIELIRLDDKIPLHMHPKENHFVYVLRGTAKGNVGSLTGEVGPGALVAIPAGVPHSFERTGNSPVEILLFSTPPFTVGDIVWLEKK